MYTRFFGLAQVPFSIAPDPRYLFMSERHREALAHLLYGLDGGGGFVLLTGEIGAGKTTVCRLFLEQIPPECNVAYIFNPKLTVIELLQSICDEFGVRVEGKADRLPTVKDFIDPLNAFLLASHGQQKNNVLIIDEAQNLSPDVLEQLRLLTNLETSRRKLLQIILIGQPELRSMLAAPELEQLAQRVVARFHLAALSEEETGQYIAHRLSVAGMERPSPFGPRVVRQVHRRARGVPRRINLLCDRALLGAYANGKANVDVATVERAAREVFDLGHVPRARMPGRAALAAGGLLFAGLLGAVAAHEFGWIARAPATLPAVAAATSTTGTSAPPRVRPGMSMDLASIGQAAARATPASSAPTSTSNPTAPASAVTSTNPANGTTSVSPANPTNSTNPTNPAGPKTPGLDARDPAAATRRLAQSWNLTLDGNEPCRAAQKHDAYCYNGKGGLAEIRQLDRPCLLTLHDDDNEKYYAVLMGLTRDTATLRIGDVTESVTLKALASRWRGGFTTLWRGPPGFERDIARGDHGGAVDWLGARLATLNGGQPPAQNAAFDAAMSARVREFQLVQGLAPDGMPGRQTLIRLAMVTGESGPRLQSGVPLSAATVPAPLRK